MKVLNQFKALSEENLKNVVMTIGTFDGVHLGHQKVIQEVVQRAKKKGAPSLVLTYAHHPSRVLSKNKKHWVPLLTELPQKLDLLKEMGVDYVLLLPFNARFAKMNPEEFIEKKVCGSVKLSQICIGKDTTFGKGGEGNVPLLKRLSKELGFNLVVVPNVKVGSYVVRSTKIRQLIQKGEVAKASSFLGRPYTIQGKVVHGNKIGRKIGLPTANLNSPSESLLGQGVYAVKVRRKKKEYIGAFNIGFRPTLGKKSLKKSFEVHLLGFNKEIYGEELQVFFFHKIRNEKKFSNLDNLKKQIQSDLEQTRKLFNKLN